jgi:hypothetical protein
MLRLFEVPEMTHMQEIEDSMAVPNSKFSLTFENFLELVERVNFARLGHSKKAQAKR